MAFGLLIGADGKCQVGSDGTVGMGDAGKNCCCDNCTCSESDVSGISSVLVDVTGSWDIIGACGSVEEACPSSVTSIVLSVYTSPCGFEEPTNHVCVDSKVAASTSVFFDTTVCRWRFVIIFAAPDGSDDVEIDYLSDISGVGGLFRNYNFSTSFGCGSSANFPSTVTVS